VVRLILCAFYIVLGLYGLGILLHPPQAFENVIGQSLVMAFAIFMLAGGIFGAFAILPGIWFVERVGLISLTSAMLIYVLLLFALGLQSYQLCIPIAFILVFTLRWLEIRWAQLAPRKG
jgi:hypothetical protein